VSPHPAAQSRGEEPRLGPWLALGLTLLSAGLYGLAFPTLSWRPAAWVAVAPLLVALRASSPARAMGLGYVFAVAGAWAVADWVPASISLYFDQSTPFAVLFFLIVASVMVAPYYVAFAGLFAALAPRFNLMRPLLAAAAWTSAEWARGALFTAAPVFSANPWGLLGYSQAGFDPLQQLAAVTGVVGISFVLVLVSATLADLALDAFRGRLSLRRSLASIAIALLPAAAAFGYGWAALRAADAEDPLAGEKTRVAIVQGHLGLAERWHRHFHGRNLQKYLSLTQEVLEAGKVEIVFWPEASMTFSMADQPNYQRTIASLLRTAGVELIAGIPHQEPDDAGYFNSVYLLSEQGEIIARYDKQYLMPWTEYIPLGNLESVRRRFARFREFNHGSSSPVPLPSRAGPAGILLCNEVALPEVARRRVQEGAAYLVNPANDSWSRDPRYAKQWFDIVSFRSIEQRRYLVRASTAGPSVILDPWARVQVSTGSQSRSAVAGWIRPRSGRTPYARVGDLFAAACTVAVLAACAAPALARRSRTRSR
jgi:apolipoprotein N-acyltransferase